MGCGERWTLGCGGWCTLRVLLAWCANGVGLVVFVTEPENKTDEDEGDEELHHVTHTHKKQKKDGLIQKQEKKKKKEK